MDGRPAVGSEPPRGVVETLEPGAMINVLPSSPDDYCFLANIVSEFAEIDPARLAQQLTVVVRLVAKDRRPSQVSRLERAIGYKIIAPWRSNIVHLHRPWRAIQSRVAILSGTSTSSNLMRDLCSAAKQLICRSCCGKLAVLGVCLRDRRGHHDGRSHGWAGLDTQRVCG